MADLNVLIVAENPLARMGLASLLTGQPGLFIAGQTAGGDALPEEIDLYKPDVIAWEWGWGGSPEGMSEAQEANLPVLALLNNAGQAADAWAAGARGLIFHDADADALAAALVAVGQGLAVIDPTMTTSVLAGAAPAPDAAIEPLTPREREVLQLLAEGLPNKTIASRLSVTDHTVKFHVNSIMGKLGVQSRTEAVVRATRLGLIIL